MSAKTVFTRSMIFLVAIGFILHPCPFVMAQGDLAPSGPPAAVMKTLQQVEPRTPIASAAYTITQSGSYYLTTNVAATGNGIVIQAHQVTLDLMGFSLTGDRDSSDSGIMISGATNAPLRGIVVKNGIISGFGSGINAASCLASRFESLISISNATDGIFLDATDGTCAGNVISGCTASQNGHNGIRLEGRNGQCIGNTIRMSALNGNSTNGISLEASQGKCDGNMILNCNVSRSGRFGISMSGGNGQCNGNSIVGCTVSSSGSYGIELTGSDGKCSGNTILNCLVNDSVARGINFILTTNTRVEGNHVSGTTGTGGLTYGIQFADSSRCFVFCNTSTGHSNDFNVSFSSTYGPTVTNTGALDSTGNESHPWANFAD